MPLIHSVCTCSISFDAHTDDEITCMGRYRLSTISNRDQWILDAALDGSDFTHSIVNDLIYL